MNNFAACYGLFTSLAIFAGAVHGQQTTSMLCNGPQANSELENLVLQQQQQIGQQQQQIAILFNVIGGNNEFIYGSCNEILSNDPNAPSGEYWIRTSRGRILRRVYCEMGLNGGGYTFIHPFAMPKLTNAELQAMFTDKTSFLMRLRKKDNTQPYAVLQQLTRYGSILLKFGLDDYVGYRRPVNADLLGSFLYYGFLPISVAANYTTQGLKVNNIETTFVNGDANPNSYIALFPNFRESVPSNYSFYDNWTFSDQLFSRFTLNPSSRVIPDDYFMFMETHWGGGGTYTQSDGRLSANGILGAAIGIKYKLQIFKTRNDAL